MRSQVDQASSLREPVIGENGGGGRHQDLTTVADRPQPSAMQDAVTEIVPLVPQTRLAGMHRHADPDHQTVRPRFHGQNPLGVQGGCHRIRRPRERTDNTSGFAGLYRPDATVQPDRLLQHRGIPEGRRQHGLGWDFSTP